VAQVIRADTRGQTVVVNQSGDSLAEAVGRNLRDAELLADIAPLLAEVVRVPQRSRRGRENYCALAPVRQVASDSKHFDREKRYGHYAPTGGGLRLVHALETLAGHSHNLARYRERARCIVVVDPTQTQ
jgi:hypothetical protein